MMYCELLLEGFLYIDSFSALPPLCSSVSSSFLKMHLASLLREQGEVAEARRLYKVVLEGFRQ